MKFFPHNPKAIRESPNLIYIWGLLIKFAMKQKNPKSLGYIKKNHHPHLLDRKNEDPQKSSRTPYNEKWCWGKFL